MTLIQKITKSQKVLNKVSTLYNLIKIKHNEIFNDIWRDEDPQKLINDIGYERAIALFTLSASLQDILASADPEYVKLTPPRTVDFTADSIIIGDLPVVEEEVIPDEEETLPTEESNDII